MSGGRGYEGGRTRMVRVDPPNASPAVFGVVVLQMLRFYGYKSAADGRHHVIIADFSRPLTTLCCIKSFNMFFALNKGTKVILNVYDLSSVNDYLYAVGMGLHHSGVEVLGREYSFASGGGIFDSSPKDAPGATFRESIELGTFDGGSAELNSAISDLRSEFGPDRYNLIRRNCNHFANALVWRLLGRTIPGHVNRLADFGVCFSCLLPKKLLEEAPVGPNAGSGGTSGFQVLGGTGREKKEAGGKSSTAAFTGSGMVLGSTQQSDSSSRIPLLGSWTKSDSAATKGGDSLTDRREKARMAALARMNAQNGSGTE